MSFFFKKDKSKPGSTTSTTSLTPSAATRDIKSADGLPSSSSSPIPAANATSASASASAAGTKPASPSPGASVNNSLNSLAANHDPALVRPGTASGASSRPSPQQEERSTLTPSASAASSTTAAAAAAATAADPANSPPPPSPEQKVMRDPSLRNGNAVPMERGQELARPQRPPAQAPARPLERPPDAASPYPWVMRPLNFTVQHTNPFPRYGAAVNAVSSKDGSIYLMGGLINGSTVKGDLWMVDASPSALTCFPVATTSEGPGPRVGHASLLVGNAFIVFGGDTKMDEGDQLDDTLYLLNTSTKQWSRALPAGPRPPGRYGHSLNILGSKIYIFGGQVEGYFFNDLVAFDLNALQQATNRWEILIQNTIDGGPPHGQIPPARTNHTMVTWGDKLFLFGGTDGVNWFNDVWSYSPHTNSWTQLECIGYIPSPREGHAAALVGDVMYIFGGRTEEGTDLGDLAAFRIGSRRWYTFQNMGPSPSPRSGHSMTTVGKQIVVLAGEPSSAPRDPVELSYAYFLDTAKIKYPPDNAAPVQANDSARARGTVPPPVAAGRIQGSPKELQERERFTSNEDLKGRGEPVRSGSASSGSRLPQATAKPLGQQLPAPTGPPPQTPTSQQQQKPNGVPAARQPSRPERALSPQTDADRGINMDRVASPTSQQSRASPGPALPSSPSFPPERSYYESENANSSRLYKPDTYQPSQNQAVRSASSEGERVEEAPPKQSLETREQMPKVKELQQEEDIPQDSGIGSSPSLTQQHDIMVKELEQLKQRNAWYYSELTLARKSGYQTRSAESPVMDERAPDVFGEEDKPLIEALLKMKAELARVQETIEEQSKSAAERIAEMEKQRDVAIGEAAYAKTRLAGQQGSPQLNNDVEGKRSPDQERNNDISKRLASSLNAQAELSRKLEGLARELENERKARVIAEDTAEAAQKRATELDAHQQQHGSEMESMRAELYESQRSARDVSASHAELKSQHDLLTVDKREMQSKLDGALADTQNHTSILASLRDAVASSTEKADMLERRVEEERGQRAELEQQLRQLKSDHEARSLDLGDASRRLREAEEMAEKHAQEAKSHRGALLAGLDKATQRDVEANQAADERVTLLQQQVESANAMVRQNQGAADSAEEKLRRAEERIAGLEAFQQQASRESLSLRKQLQTTAKENQDLAAKRTDLEQKLQSQMLEANAIAVQHASLRDILGERGINASDVRRSRVLDSPSSLSRFGTPDLQRVRELESQLEASLKSHDDMKAQFEEVSERDEKMKREYEDKLTALDNDHQAAVKYLRGTERMLSRMKQELQRVKDENRDLKKKVDKAKEEQQQQRGMTPDPAAAAGWEAERDGLKSQVAELQTHAQNVSELEGRMSVMQQQLQIAEDELQQARMRHATTQADLTTLQATHSQSRSDIEKLQKENNSLEERARDAENKVQLLLDQVESSVDNYRRQSRIGESGGAGGGGGGPTANGTYASPHAHTRDLSDSDHSNVSGGGGGGGGGGAGGGDVRDSQALDSLASELETLRSHWETTNRNYHYSDRFDFERTPRSGSGEFGLGSGGGGGGGALGSSGFAGLRRGLDVSEDELSRPTTSNTELGMGDDDDDDEVEEVGKSSGVGSAGATPTLG